MPALRILTYNILNGGAGREARLRETIDRIKPDIAILTEARTGAALDAIAGGVGDHRIVGSSLFGRSRVAVISRFPFVETVRHGTFWARRKWVDVVVRPFDGPALNIHGVQLFPHQAWPAELWRRRQIQRLLRHLQQRSWMPQVVAGDFNAIKRGDPVRRSAAPWWVKAQWWSQAGVVPRWALKPMMQAGFMDCFRQCNPSADGFTVYAGRPSGRLDYIFATSDLQDSLQSSVVVDAAGDGGHPSDHLPVWVDVQWPPKELEALDLRHGRAPVAVSRRGPRRPRRPR